MSNEEPLTPANSEAKKSSWWDWIWPTISSVIVTKLFGLAGALVIFGTYYWLKPKLGTLGATAASGALGIVFAIGLSAILANFAATPTETVPRAETTPSPTAIPNVDAQEQQLALLSAAKEIIAKYPQLDPDSSAVDQSAIDFVISRRDAYIANGHAIDIALRMAANDYGEQLRASQQSEAEKRYVKQVSSYRFTQPSVSQPSTPASNDYIRRKNEGCQPKDVMTDEEIARCRGR